MRREVISRGIKKRIIVWVGFLSLLLFPHCSRDYPISQEKDVRFPLCVGNWWTLSREWKMVFDQPVSPWGDSIVYRDTIYWEIMGRDVLQGYKTYVLHNELRDEQGGSTYSLNWYSESWDGCQGLYSIGYWNAGGSVIPPRFPKKYKFVFADREFDSPAEIFEWACGKTASKGDTILRIPPRKVLVYPLEIGKEWVAFDDPWLQVRKVVGKESVSTPAGHFPCYQIQVLGDWSEGMTWYDWFWNKGLVKRCFWSTGKVIDENGREVGTYESTDIYLLEDCSVR
jgi:hypothetical protein